MQLTGPAKIWKQSPFGGLPNGVAYGNGRFVAVGNAGIILASADGITWTNVNSPFTNTILYGAAYGGGSFVAVGYWSIESGFSTILTSPDGFTWTERTPGSVQTLWGAAYGDGQFVVVGDQSTILQSARVAGASLTAIGFGAAGFELIAAGTPGTPYRLQVSTNLNAPSWNDLNLFTNVGPTISLIDTTATSFPARFY